MPTMPPSGPKSSGGSGHQAKRRLARETPAAREPETPRLRPILPGFANSAARRRPGAAATAPAIRQVLCGDSSVACGTACELLGIANAVFGHELLTELALISRKLVIHVENLLARPDLARRVAMTVEAPFHQQRGRLLG